MTTDKKIKLARKLEQQLIRVTASEWSKWCKYVEQAGLKKALQFAQAMQNSPSLRRGPQRSYETIVRVIEKFQRQLESLSPEEIAEVLGYTSRWIVARREKRN